MAGKVVLLIEPDTDARKRVAKYLEDAAYYVVAVSEAESAMLGFEYMAPDVVLVAYPLGERAGDDIARHVRASSRPLTPVVAMFPFPPRRVAVRAMDDGCVDVIPKPVDRLLLEDLLRGLLDGRSRTSAQPKPNPGRAAS
jgi:DNA-binding response OmpR family regulator